MQPQPFGAAAPGMISINRCPYVIYEFNLQAQCYSYTAEDAVFLCYGFNQKTVQPSTMKTSHKPLNSNENNSQPVRCNISTFSYFFLFKSSKSVQRCTLVGCSSRFEGTVIYRAKNKAFTSFRQFLINLLLWSCGRVFAKIFFQLKYPMLIKVDMTYSDVKSVSYPIYRLRLGAMWLLSRESKTDRSLRSCYQYQRKGEYTSVLISTY